MTSAPSASTSAHSVRLPPVNAQFDYQIGGAYSPVAFVEIVDRDRTSHPAPGVYNVCYINAFQTQADHDHWWRSHHRKLLLRTKNGRAVEDPGWPGEFVLDVGTAHKRAALARIIGRWIDGCASKGFQAIEPDNLDSYSRSHHLLTLTDDVKFATLLVTRAHADGLAIAQKNTAELHHRGRRTAGFDFAIAEECQVYSECSSYTRAYGAQVVEIEYTDNGRRYYRRACAARGARISILLRDRNVVPSGRKHYVYRAC
jgi:Glycoside-hydrolase family GH114